MIFIKSLTMSYIKKKNQEKFKIQKILSIGLFFSVNTVLIAEISA